MRWTRIAGEWARGRPVWLTVPLLVLMFPGGCTTTVWVPRVVAEHAETVYLVDYGRHSSLVLPPQPLASRLRTDESNGVSLAVFESGESLAGHAVEYAYGEWKWFALNENKWPDLFRTMLVPTQGALGRRDLGMSTSTDSLRWQIVCEAFYPLEVDGALLRQLRDRLDERFESHAETRHDNELYSMQFVHDDSAYSLAHNCNQVVVQWLRELGCKVSGATVDAKFRIVRDTE